MQVIFIRHGEPDYQPCEQRGFIGHGLELAPLSQKGISQAQKVAKSSLLTNAQMILSSPFTRALQTASYVAMETKLGIVVEVDLREWQPDLTFQNSSAKGNSEAYADYRYHNGIYPEHEEKTWETAKMVHERAANCLKGYASMYDKIIVVAHGEIMRQFAGDVLVDYCGIIDVSFG